MDGERSTTAVVHLLQAVTVELDLAAVRSAHRHSLGGTDLLERRAGPGDHRRTLLAVTDGARETGKGFFGPLVTEIERADTPPPAASG